MQGAPGSVRGGWNGQWEFQDPQMAVPIIYKASISGLCKGIYPQNMAKHMVQYLHFRTLEFPLKWGGRATKHNNHIIVFHCWPEIVHPSCCMWFIFVYMVYQVRTPKIVRIWIYPCMCSMYNIAMCLRAWNLHVHRRKGQHRGVYAYMSRLVNLK